MSRRTRTRRQRVPHPALVVTEGGRGWWVWCPGCGFESRVTSSELVARQWRAAHRDQTPPLVDNT